MLKIKKCSNSEHTQGKRRRWEAPQNTGEKKGKGDAGKLLRHRTTEKQGSFGSLLSFLGDKAHHEAQSLPTEPSPGQVSI